MKILTTTILLIISLATFAQEASSPWSGNLKAGLTLYSGNVNKFNMKGGGNVSHKDSAYEFQIFVAGNYSEKDHKANKEEYSGGLKYDFRPFNTFSPFALVQGYSNRQKGIKLRTSGLVGVKYGYYHTSKSDFSLSFAFQNDYDVYFESEDVAETSQPDKNILRFSFRPKFKHKFTDNIYFEHLTFYQPSIGTFSDYRVYSKTLLSNQLWKSFFVEFDFIYEFDNVTVYNGVLKEDYSFFVTLKYKF